MMWLFTCLLLLITATSIEATKSDSASAEENINERNLQSSPRIINGEEALIGRFPYVVSLQDIYNLDHRCGGSLVAPDVVLSAAHCADRAEDMAVRTNAHTLHDPIENSEILPVTDVILHPDYETLPSFLDHDVMLLKLGTPSNQRPLLRLNPYPAVPVDDELLIVMGWGTISRDLPIQPEALQFVEVIAISNEECIALANNGTFDVDYSVELSDDMICYTRQNETTGGAQCSGDSGGPLIIPGNTSEEDIQVGIVSWGVGCSEQIEYSSVCSRVSYTYQFIREQVCTLSSDPPAYFNCSALNATPTLTPVTLLLHFDTYPVQTGWKLRVQGGRTIKRVDEGTYGPFVGENVTTTVLVPYNENITFTLSDSSGDGMCCENGEGFAVLYWGSVPDDDQILVYDTGDFTFSRSWDFVSLANQTFALTMAPSPAPSVTPAPSETNVDITVEILLDSFAHEVGWEIVDAITSEAVFTVPFRTYGNDEDNTIVRQTVQVRPGNAYFFYLRDSFGDGIFSGGYGAVYYGPVSDGLQLAFQPGNFGSLGIARFVASADEAEMVTSRPTRSPSSSPSALPTTEPTIGPTLFPTQTERPTGIFSEITIVIMLDRFPQEVSWTLSALPDLRTIASVPRGSYSGFSEQIVRKTVTVPTGAELRLVVEDSAGDGLCCSFGEGYFAVYLGTQEQGVSLLVYNDGTYSTRARHVFIVGKEGLINRPAPTPTSPPAVTTSPTTREPTTNPPTNTTSNTTTVVPTSVPAPSLAPTGRPPMGCFSGSTTVDVQGVGSTPISEIEIGDMVLTQHNRYEAVYSFGHRLTSARASFLQIHTKDQVREPLELSAEHMVFLEGGDAVPASGLRVGDTIQTVDLSESESCTSKATVTKIVVVEREGVYAPFTPSGSIVVNGGILASTFVSFDETSGYLRLGRGLELPISFQWLAWAFEAPHRMVCQQFWRVCESESYDEFGISDWVNVALGLSEWWIGQHALLIGAFVVPLLVGLSLVVLLESVQKHWIVAMFVVVVGLQWVRRQKRA